ncbi:translation initiation factor IF-2-like [Schistocerca nitens]|uniref:translation initiation factor IF-2-like n=1 Tax=Schistocerca nitens TaxID=7011 RepID=UPI00211828D2|nr:translation initiation factor IF-2-like [Schistocerca nitens]
MCGVPDRGDLSDPGGSRRVVSGGPGAAAVAGWSPAAILGGRRRPRRRSGRPLRTLPYKSSPSLAGRPDVRRPGAPSVSAPAAAAPPLLDSRGQRLCGSSYLRVSPPLPLSRSLRGGLATNTITAVIHRRDRSPPPSPSSAEPRPSAVNKGSGPSAPSRKTQKAPASSTALGQLRVRRVPRLRARRGSVAALGLTPAGGTPGGSRCVAERACAPAPAPAPRTRPACYRHAYQTECCSGGPPHSARASPNQQFLIQIPRQQF